jgi:hypothetical protein
MTPFGTKDRGFDGGQRGQDDDHGVGATRHIDGRCGRRAAERDEPFDTRGHDVVADHGKPGSA